MTVETITQEEMDLLAHNLNDLEPSLGHIDTMSKFWGGQTDVFVELCINASIYTMLFLACMWILPKVQRLFLKQP